MEMRIPNWVRLIVLISAIMKLGFGLTILGDPGQIKGVWPWPLPPLSARLLGASTLVSVPLALLSIGINRFALAMIPFVMMFTYRFFQLTAGLIHIDRFDLTTTISINYFGGGLLMIGLFAYVLWSGSKERLAQASESAPLADVMEWKPGAGVRWALRAIGIVYIVLGIAYLFLGKGAVTMWIDSAGMTPLTARLFASPLIGLGLGLLLISRSTDWRRVFIPATALIFLGVAATLAVLLEFDALTIKNPVAGFVALSPVILFAVGVVLLMLRPKKQAR
jgi:hypothetical protein